MVVVVVVVVVVLVFFVVVVVGRCWPYLGAALPLSHVALGPIGPMYVVPILALCRPMWADVGPMLAQAVA